MWECTADIKKVTDDKVVSAGVSVTVSVLS